MSDMAVRLRAVLSGENAGMIRSFNEAAGHAEVTSQRIANSGTAGAAHFSEVFERGTSRVGTAFNKLGTIGGSFGIPFTESLDAIGKKFETATGEATTFGQKMSAIGGLTLAVGAAAFVALGAESIHLSDQLEKVQAGLETAVKNSGVAFSNFAPFVAKANKEMAGLGFTNVQVEGALATITTATNSPAKALESLGTIADMARMKHMGLSEASQQYAKILAGNTRVIQSWGLNIDVVSGKLHSVHTAQDEVAKTTAHLTLVEAEIANGHIKSGAAAHDLAVAHEAVRSATEKYKASLESINTVISTLQQRTHGAGEEYAKTFPGQLDVAKAKLTDLGTTFGHTLTDDMQHAEVKLAEVVGWFQKHDAVANALAKTIGGVLGLAVLSFAKDTAVSMVTGIGHMVTGLFTLGGSATTTATEVSASATAITTSNATLMESFAAMTAAIEANTAAIAASTGGMAAEVSASNELIIVSNHTAAASFAEVSAASAVAETAIVADAAGAAAGVEVAGGSMVAALGPAGWAVLAVIAGAYEIKTHWHELWPAMKADAENGARDIANVIHGALDGNLGQLGSGIKGLGRGALSALDWAVTGHTLGSATPKSGGPGDSNGTSDRALQNQLLGANHLNALITGNGTPPVSGGGSSPIAIPPIAGAGHSGMSKAARAAFELAAERIDRPTHISGPTDLIGQGPTVKNLREELTPVHKAALDALVAKLNATHDVAMIKLANKLEADWKSAQDKLTSIVDSDVNAGQSELAKLQGAITSGSLNGLKNAVTGEAATKFSQLIAALVGVHTVAGNDMVDQLKQTFAETQDNLKTAIVTEQIQAQTELLKHQDQQLQDQTTAIENAARAQVQAIQDAASAMSIAMQAAATAIGDAARTVSDQANAQAQAIQDATTASHNEASARAKAIQDASQTAVDIMAQRGLYGLNLVAQQQTVALDRMREGFDTQIANAQRSIDSVTSSGHATISQAQQALDAAVSIQNSLVSQAQASAQSIASQSNQIVAGAQSQFDAQQRQVDQAIAFAADQNAYSQSKGSETQKHETEAKLALAQAQGQVIIDQAQAQLSASQNAANSANAQAQSALQSAQDQANSVKAAADAALSAAQGNASIVLAQAQQALSQASDQAAVSEAQQQALINETRQNAQSQFAGSGLVVNITGINPTDSLAIASEMSWIARTLIPNAG